jgi:hypothetical protein
MKGAAMRLPAFMQPKQPERNAASEYLRRLMQVPAAPRAEPVPARSEELPADLDQRVRLVGEW